MKCELCNDGRDFKSLSTHVKMKHGIEMKQYNEKVELMKKAVETIEDDSAFTDEDTMVEEINKTFLSDVTEITAPPSSSVDGSLSTFLSEFGFTKKDLVRLLTDNKNGKLSIKQAEERNVGIGEQGASALRHKQNPTTTNLHIAETLVKKWGFEVLSVDTKGGKQAKTWRLQA